MDISKKSEWILPQSLDFVTLSRSGQTQQRTRKFGAEKQKIEVRIHFKICNHRALTGSSIVNGEKVFCVQR